MTRAFMFYVIFVTSTSFLHEGFAASYKVNPSALSGSSLSSGEFSSIDNKYHVAAILEPAVVAKNSYHQEDPMLIRDEWYSSDDEDYGNYYNDIKIFGFQGPAPAQGANHLHNKKKYDLWNHNGRQENSVMDKDYYTLNRKTAGKHWNKYNLLRKTMRKFQRRGKKPMYSPYDLATVDAGGWGKP